jgi:hypothetical protein
MSDSAFENALKIFNGGAADPPPPPHGFTPRAIKPFQLIKRTLARCTCVHPIMHINEQGLWASRACAACRAVDDPQFDLARELKLPPWIDEPVQSPDVRNPYPPGYDAHEKWVPDVDAQRRWRELDAALKLAS